MKFHNPLEIFEFTSKLMDFENSGKYGHNLMVGDWISRSILNFMPIPALKLSHHHGVICSFDKNGEPLVVQLNISYFPHVFLGVKISKMSEFLNSDGKFRLYARMVNMPNEIEIKTRVDAIIESKRYDNFKYSLEKNNCEHLSTQILTGIPISYQILLLDKTKDYCNKCIVSTSNKKFENKIEFVRQILKDVNFPAFTRCKWKRN